MSAIWLTIKEAITSKKFIAAVAGILVALAARRGLNLDPDSVQNVIYVIVAYLVGQGIADHGKEAAKVQGTVSLASNDITNPPQPVKDKLI